MGDLTLRGELREMAGFAARVCDELRGAGCGDPGVSVGAIGLSDALHRAVATLEGIGLVRGAC